MALRYTLIPTLTQWRRDSSVAFAFRSSDMILSRIDTLLDLFHNRSTSTAAVIACDLFFTLDYWLRSYRTTTSMEKGRLEAIQALYAAVANLLCKRLNCTINSLPRELELMFGRELSDLGVQTDTVEQRGMYILKRAEIQKYRLRFRGGRVYRYTWMDKETGPMKLVPVNSSDYYDQSKDKKHTLAGWGSFVMTMNREIYMAKHWVGQYGEENGFFHSAYLGGQPVSCAGSMLVEHGRILKVRGDSGHYKPTDSNMFALLQALQMLGVLLKDMKVVSFDGKVETSAPQFFKTNANWDLLVKNQEVTHADNKWGHLAQPDQGSNNFNIDKHRPNLNKVPDLRNQWVMPLVTKDLKEWIGEVGGKR